MREEDPRGHSGVLPKLFSYLPVALPNVAFKRQFEMSPRLGQIPLESASQSEYPVSDACVGWSSLGFRLSKKFLGSLPTCADVATQQTPETPTIECGKSLTGTFRAQREIADAFECGLGLTGRPTL